MEGQDLCWTNALAGDLDSISFLRRAGSHTSRKVRPSLWTALDPRSRFSKQAVRIIGSARRTFRSPGTSFMNSA